MVQTLWKTVWQFLKNLKIELSCDPELPLLGIAPKIESRVMKRHLHNHVCNSVTHTSQSPSNMDRDALRSAQPVPTLPLVLPGFLSFGGRPEIQSPAGNFSIFKCWQLIENFQNIIWVWPSSCQFVAFVRRISNFRACEVLWLGNMLC